jgi:SET domain
MQPGILISLLASLLECSYRIHGLASPNGGQLTLETLKAKLLKLQSDGQSKESILGNRLIMDLDRTRIGPSLVENAGRGLFAKMDCEKGELLTCYPGDLLVYSKLSDGPEIEEDDDIVWGSHIQESDRISEEEIRSELLSAYSVQVADEIAVLGLPFLDGDMAYAGHFANDGACPPQRESQIASYVLESNEFANAMHISLGGCHMVTVATRNIPKGGEILVTYGPDYWMEQSSWIGDEDDYGASTSLPRGKGFG